MSLITNKVNNKQSSGQQPQQEMIIKTEAAEEASTFDYDSPLASPKLKSEDDHSSCDPSSELNSLENNSSSFPVIKIEPEDSSPGPDDLHQVQGAQNLTLKEEVDIEDHKPGWELIKGSSSNVGMCKDGPVRCEYVQENESRSSERTREEQAKYNCAHCLYKTNNRFAFIRHYNCKHSKNAEVFKCQECSYETKHRGNFNQHYNHKHSKDPEVFKCQECSYETKERGNLNKHYNRKHSPEAHMYECQECSYETRIKHDLTRHYTIKHSKDAKVFKCQECSYKTKQRGNFNRHYNHKHSKDPKVFKCQECSYETNDRGNLNKHYNRKHSKDPEVYKCQECSYETKIKLYLTKHYKRKHKKILKCTNVRSAHMKQTVEVI